MAGSLSLSAVTPAMFPLGGAVTLSFPAPNIGRIWQGSIVIPNAPSTAIWTIQNGGFTIANLIGNGPFGPLQIQSGQILTIVGTGAGTANLVAYLFGVNDPADAPTSYTGPAALPSPAAPTTVTLVANSEIVNVPPGALSTDHPPNEIHTLCTFSATGTFLGAPGAGLRYRLFQVTVVCGVNYGTNYAEMDWTDAFGAGDRVPVGQIPGGIVSNTGTNQLSFLPSGLPLATNSAITVASSSLSWYSVVYTIETT